MLDHYQSAKPGAGFDTVNTGRQMSKIQFDLRRVFYVPENYGPAQAVEHLYQAQSACCFDP